MEQPTYHLVGKARLLGHLTGNLIPHIRNLYIPENWSYRSNYAYQLLNIGQDSLTILAYTYFLPTLLKDYADAGFEITLPLSVRFIEENSFRWILILVNG